MIPIVFLFNRYKNSINNLRGALITEKFLQLLFF